MSLAPSISVPGSRFNTLPLAIGLFCLLWSYAFVAGKIGVTHCPPLILLAARFSLAGILILGATLIRGEAWSLSWRDAVIFAVLGIANNALYLGLGYTGLQSVSAGLGGLIVSANPVFTEAQIAAIEIPVAVVNGGADFVASMGDRLIDALGVKQALLPGIGHFDLTAQPAFRTIAIDFLSQKD